MSALGTIGTAGQRRAALTFVDQSVSSVSNFASGVVIARLSGAAEFGRYALVMMIWLAVVGLHRALITEPVIISSGAAPERRAVVADGFSAELVLGGLLSLLVAAGGAASIAAGFPEGSLMLALAPWFVALLIQDYWRAMAFRQYKPQLALASDLFFAAVQALALVALLLLGWRSASAVITAWGVGAAAGAALGLRWFPAAVAPRRGWALLRRLWPLSRWMAADFLTTFSSDQTYLLFLAFLLSKADYGGFRAAYSLLGPVAVIALVAGNIGLPGAARRTDPHDPTALRLFARRLTQWTTLFMALYATAVAAAGPQILDVLYGPEFARFGRVAALIALAYVLTGSVFGQGIALKAAGHVRRLWLLRVTVAVASFVSVTVLVRSFGLAGAGWAAVANTALYCAGVYVAYRGGLSHPDRRTPTGWSTRAMARTMEEDVPLPLEAESGRLTVERPSRWPTVTD